MGMMNAALQKITMRRNYLLKEELFMQINSELPQTKASILAFNLKYQQALAGGHVLCWNLKTAIKKKHLILTIMQFMVKWMNLLVILAFTE